MANIANLDLEIEVANNGPNLQAIVTVKYDIEFSSYDQHSNQPYTEVCRLIGDDTGITPAEDGVDDSIAGGQLLPVVLSPVPGPIPIPRPVVIPVASDGRARLHRELTKTLPLSALDEDKPPVPNPDEIRAQVTLTPVLPTAIVRESNQVLLNI